MSQQARTMFQRSAGEWLVSLPSMLILLTVIFLGTGEYIHSQLLKVGEAQWDQYFILRGDIPNPDCNPQLDVERETARLLDEANAAAADELELFAETPDPVAIRASVEQSRVMCQEKWDIARKNQERVTDGVRAFRAVETGVAKMVTWVGSYKQFLLLLLLLICAMSTTLTRHHIGLRSVHTRKDYYVAVSMQLCAHLMLVLTAVTYRNAELTAVSEGVEVQNFFLHAWWIAGFAGLALISVYQLLVPPRDLESGGSFGHALLAVPLYAYMAVSTSVQFWLIPAMEEITTGMSAGAAYYQGIAVYLSQMMELSGMFLSLALYVWIGMLLKQTRVTELFFNVLRPWTLSPELLCFVVLVLAAWPTAFTGASGIFVIAAGTILYAELRRNNARRGLALAATAMSGSMGVVLAPCLLVVIVAALNKDVTTGEMYHYGLMIYLLTAVLFLLVSQIFRRDPVRIAPIATALPQSLKLMGPLVPYVVIIIATLGVYTQVFDQGLDEFSAPYILPVILIAVLLYDKSGAWVANLCSGIVLVGVMVGGAQLAGDIGSIESSDMLTALVQFAIAAWLAVLSFGHAREWERNRLSTPAHERRRPVEIALREATNETTGHIGALLMLMALSVSVGGMIERSHVMELFPQMDSLWGTMTVLLIVMVFIGMIMDPYGAVILVNATIAQVAFQAGIDPLHFWMFALLSFELGYLTPPVALNHLLTRHLIGDREVQLAKDDAAAAGMGWWYRHERYALPVVIMFIALVIVAYGPLVYPDVKADLPLWVQELFTFRHGE